MLYHLADARDRIIQSALAVHAEVTEGAIGQTQKLQSVVDTFYYVLDIDRETFMKELKFKKKTNN